MATQFLIKNHINFINQFKTYIQSNRIHYPSVLEGDDNDELDEIIDQLESANNSESDFNGGYFGVTYDVNREAKDDTGHFYLDYLGGTEIYHDERVYDPTVKKFPQNIDTEKYDTPPQTPRKGGRRRKRKTRKKRGGNTERDAYIYRLIQPLHLSLQDQIDELGVRADAIENDRDALEERIEALERQRSGTGGTGGGKRKKKTRKKKGGKRSKRKTRKRKRKKKTSRKKYRKRRTKKKSRKK